jgi:NAD(P)-dependent dehydrogenase (short-subunit alcohol dehydrogenase family)
MPTALITGASRGLGLEFATQYAKAGWQVIATCRDPGKADALRALAGAGNGLVQIEALDVGDAAGTRRLAGAVGKRPIDLVIANAGLYGTRDQGLKDLDDAEWGEVMRINVMAPMRLAALLTDSVAASTGKQMAFVSSRLGSMASNEEGGGYVYRSSKAALNAVVKSLSVDLKPRGITAVALHPGWVRTDMGGPSAPLDAPTSVSGMVKVLAGLKPKDSGTLIEYTGQTVPW